MRLKKDKIAISSQDLSQLYMEKIMKLKKTKIEISSQDLRFVIDHFGKDAQRHKAIEELNELAVALAHDDRANIQEEMADVWLMLLQMMIVFNISEDSIFCAMDYKIQRTLRRIENEIKKGE